MKQVMLFLAEYLLLATNSFADSANELIKMAGVNGGLIVQAGCGNASLTADLRASSSYIVHALDVDAAKLARARKTIQTRGVYGPVSVHLFDGVHMPYSENLVNLLIVGAEYNIPRSEVTRVLVPNGVAIINGEKTVKPVPDEIDEWTHWLHGPDGNAVARDRVVGPPRRLQWMARPYWARLHDAPPSTIAMVSSGGRVFYVSDEGPAGTYSGLEDKWFLVARDAYNGTLLWKRPMPKWGWKQWTANWHARNNQPFQLPKRLVSISDRVYVTLGYNEPVSALDAATGEVLRTFEGTQGTDEILCHEGRLILSVNKAVHDPLRTEHEPLKKSIAVVEADTGKMLWKTGDYAGLSAKTDSIGPNGRLELAVGGGRIYFSDHDCIVTLDVQTGREIWRTPRSFGPKLNANFNTRMYELSVLVYSDGVVLLAQPEGTISFHSIPGTLCAFDARDGRLLWKHRYGGWVHNTQPNVFVIDGTVWIHEHQEGAVMQGGKRMILPQNLQNELEYAALGLDLHTGSQKLRLSTKAVFNVGHHHRCYRHKATERFLLTSRRGVEFIDIESGENDINHWTRGDCHLGIMPGNGLLYTTPHPCSCYIDSKLNGYFALAPAAESSTPNVYRPSFVRGPAFGTAVTAGFPHSEDWWTFRGNAKRSGAAETPVAGNLVPAWKVTLGAECGPLSIAEGKVFAPVIDQHRIVALNAATGAILWEFVAGARVDTPPTIYKGLALFGSADGWAYCLRASDGELIWKRRVAPRQRLVGVQGPLESAWPAHGSILVHDGVAYLAAGRSSFLDGGIHLYAIQPEKGEIIEQRTEFTLDPETDKMAADPSYTSTMPGMLSDILVTDGSAIWMRNNLVFGDNPSRQGRVYATTGFRDDTWFNRTTWKVAAATHAQLLVCDESTAYAVEAYESTSRAKAFVAGGKGYHLFARSLKASTASVSNARQGEAARRGAKPRVTVNWSVQVPVRGTAMALAGNTLFLAGAPDIVDPHDPLASFEGRKGGVLCAFSATDGGKLSEITVDALPVWDGMAVAQGKLFLAMRDGTITCFQANSVGE
ncbi:MAG: outer membrane protein assembly factor BamB family protein [Planctomycetota bacterium]|jgi:outer membrane protein assembly factor BamB